VLAGGGAGASAGAGASGGGGAGAGGVGTEPKAACSTATYWDSNLRRQRVPDRRLSGPRPCCVPLLLEGAAEPEVNTERLQQRESRIWATSGKPLGERENQLTN
jgi:hypothetical protein